MITYDTPWDHYDEDQIDYRWQMPEWNAAQGYTSAEMWENATETPTMATLSNDDANWDESRRAEMETGNEGRSATWETGVTDWYSTEWEEPVYEERL